MSLSTTPPDDDYGGHILQFPHSPTNHLTTGPILQDKAPLQWAERFLDDEFYHADHYRLVRYRSEWLVWQLGVWVVVSTEVIRGLCYQWAHRQSIGKIEENKEFRPNRAKIGDLLEALQSITGIDDRNDMPCLLGRLDLDPALAISVANGIVDLRSQTKLLTPTPLFFSANKVEYNYDPGAGEAVEWQRFLESIWPRATKLKQRAVLHELFGYLLTSDTRAQKAFLLVGPRRSGKGTIAKVIRDLVGRDSYTAPTTSDLEQQFGLEPFIGKRVALIPDARFSAKSDKAAVAEKLLSITGEDTQNINRKNRPHWTGRLYSRIVLMSNELPALQDSSGALVSRMIILPMQTSFYGREDTQLEQKILAEMPAIFLWAIRGLARLRDTNRWRFTAIPEAEDLVSDMLAISSPISEFTSEVIEEGDDFSVEKQIVYGEWKIWCGNNGHPHPGSSAMFSQKLKGLLPHMHDVRTGSGSNRGPRRYQGIRLRTR